LGQVMGIIDGPSQVQKRSPDPSTESSASRVLNDVWEIAEFKRQGYLNNITFADLVKKCYPERLQEGVSQGTPENHHNANSHNVCSGGTLGETIAPTDHPAMPTQPLPHTPPAHLQ
jgi:Predicted transcriptional regulator